LRIFTRYTWSIHNIFCHIRIFPYPFISLWISCSIQSDEKENVNKNKREKTLVSVQYSIHLSTAVCDIQGLLQLLLSMEIRYSLHHKIFPRLYHIFTILLCCINTKTNAISFSMDDFNITYILFFAVKGTVSRCYRKVSLTHLQQINPLSIYFLLYSRRHPQSPPSRPVKHTLLEGIVEATDWLVWLYKHSGQEKLDGIAEMSKPPSSHPYNKKIAIQ
jgi:hypothetical protein